MPTKSYIIAFLAVCGVTHYVYIPYDQKHITIVGPSAAIATLIDLSNVATTTRLTETQLATLRNAFGMGDAWTTADTLVTLWERRFLFCIAIACSMVLWRLPRIIAESVVVLAGVGCTWKYIARGVRTVLLHIPRRRGLVFRDVTMEVATTDSELGTGVPESIVPYQSLEIELSAAPAMLLQTTPQIYGSREHVYSVMAARSYYYEVVAQRPVTTRHDEVIVRFEEKAQMHAVKPRSNFVHYLAERTIIPDDASLHICVHNPMVEPYLTELYQNFQKGVDRQNLLLVILPPLFHFDASMGSPRMMRTRTSQSTQFVATLSDFESLLLQMTAGFMPRVVFILPIDQGSTSSDMEVWKSCERVLGADNCHWEQPGLESFEERCLD